MPEKIEQLSNILTPCFIEDEFQQVTLDQIFVNLANQYAVIQTERRSTFNSELAPILSKNSRQTPTYFHTGSELRPFVSDVYLHSQVVAQINNCYLIGGYGHIVFSGSKTIANQFGTKNNFPEMMSSHGAYFGFQHGKFNLLAHGSSVNKVFTGSVGLKVVDDTEHSAILISNDNNDDCFTHWIYGVFYKLFALNKVINLIQKPVFVASAKLKDWQLQFLYFFFPNFKEIPIVIVTGVSFFRRLFIIGSDINCWHDGKFLAWLSRVSGEAKSESNEFERIFITRDDAVILP
jgi:hypothetical protein